MAWRDRVRGILNNIGEAINDFIGGDQPELTDYDEEPEEIYDEPPEGPATPPEDVGDGPGDRRTIRDDEGVPLGTYTYQEWYDYSLLHREGFIYEFGFSTIVLRYRRHFLELLQETFGIQWGPAEWKAWHDEYAARNG